MAESIDPQVLEFLMEGDPAIRWQVMRDLLGASEADWGKVRSRVSREGWGSQFLDLQLADGGWKRERWTDAVWTMVQLCEIGLVTDDDRCQRGFNKIVGSLCPQGKPVEPEHLIKNMDQCHIGFWLRIGATYCPEDPRLPGFITALLSLQFSDGGWNCRIRTKPKTQHSSFHTTFNVLEGLRAAAAAGLLAPERFSQIEDAAINFMLEHKLYRSDKNGEIIDHRFLDLAFPSYWHYNVLKGLDYIAGTKWIHDSRLCDPLDWLDSRRKGNGLWPVEKRIPGVVHFDMETMGKESRWNTLRALRVLVAADRLALSEALH